MLWKLHLQVSRAAIDIKSGFVFAVYKHVSPDRCLFSQRLKKKQQKQNKRITICVKKEAQPSRFVADLALRQTAEKKTSGFKNKKNDAGNFQDDRPDLMFQL